MTVSINRERTALWAEDWQRSVLLYNTWFMEAAPEAYRRARAEVVNDVERLFKATDYMRLLTPDVIKESPGIVSTLRQSTAPPIARDRLMGLAGSKKSLLETLEEKNRLPPRMKPHELNAHLSRICRVVENMLDLTLFPWLATGSEPTPQQIEIAAVVVGDRRTNVLTDPVIRNVQEARQIAVIRDWLESKGYVHRQIPAATDIRDMDPGTYAIHQNVPVFSEDGIRTNMPIDVVIQPRQALDSGMPLLIEAKSAGDETNTNKRRKEEAQKVHQLRASYGDEVDFVLFLTGYFSPGYLGYEASERIDWVWEHRVEDLALAGL